VNRVLRDVRALLVGGDPAPARSRYPRALPVLWLAMAFGTALLSLAYMHEHVRLTPALLYLVSLLVGLPLAFLPRSPLLAWRIGFVVAVVTGFTVDTHERTPWPWQPVQMFLLPVLLFAVAVRHRRGVVVLASLAMIALALAFVDPNNIVGILLAIVGIAVVGDQIRRRREAQEGLADAAERGERERARRALLEERTRIARELHDVVAHHMSLIAVRAETAPYRLDGIGAPVAAEFAGIAESSRDALTEMRRLLGVLRSDLPVPETAPQPSLADLTDLVASAREAGVDVTHEVDAPDVPDSVALSAYRVVQEALSNARRHAAGAPVHIAVRTEDGALTVDVRNGPGARGPASPGAGHGLAGMRERVEMLGGALVTQSTSDGGYVVHATLPVDAPVAR
jgi:signal transduction histidine kinase